MQTCVPNRLGKPINDYEKRQYDLCSNWRNTLSKIAHENDGENRNVKKSIDLVVV